MPEMSYKDYAIGVARDFGYGESVIEKLKKAGTDQEIAKIMRDARNQKDRMEREKAARDKKAKPMSPDEFAKKMLKIAENEDYEHRHAEMDRLMCQALRRLGYEKGIDIFLKTPSYYA